jgi:hypothetical protein
MNGHIPTPEVDHFGAGFAVGLVVDGFLDHGIPDGSGKHLLSHSVPINRRGRPSGCHHPQQ